MTADPPVTTDELKAAYKRAGLWVIGKTFAEALNTPLVRRCLEYSALARRQRHQQPLQPRLL